MEYPTLFTAGTRMFAPREVTVPEAVTIHETGHQFWHGVVGTNDLSSKRVMAGTHATHALITREYAELGTIDDVYYRPRHPYTLGLLNSLARMDQRRTDRLKPIIGQPPSLIRVPPGCPFHPRCPFATDICRRDMPALEPKDGPHHLAACHHSDQVALQQSPAAS